MAEAARADLWHSWLPLAIPAEGRRYSVADPGLEATLADAGAALVDEGAEVSIGRAGAPWVALPVEAALPQLPSRPARAAERIARAAALRGRVAAARRRLPGGQVVYWEPNLPVAFDRPRAGGRARFPLRAVVFRGDGPSLLEAILAEAGERRTTRELQLRAKGGLVLAFGEPGLLRIAVGPARSKLESQERALVALAAREPRADVADRVPWSRGRGRLGLGDWLLEAWLPGRAPHEGVSENVFGECVDFLVSLFRSGHAAATPSLEERGRVLGVPGLGGRLDSELAPLPRGFAHGDFGLPNLLVSDDRLVGVVDWEAAGDGRLPLLDLFHLYVETRLRPRQELGEGFVEHLLPWVRAGGEPWVRCYLDALGLELDTRSLESLAVAWWLDVIGYAVESYDPASRWRRDWTARNVEGPVRALRAAGILDR